MFIASAPKILGPPLNLIFCSAPPNYFGLKFLGLPLKLGGGGRAATILYFPDALIASLV